MKDAENRLKKITLEIDALKRTLERLIEEESYLWQQLSAEHEEEPVWLDVEDTPNREVKEIKETLE